MNSPIAYYLSLSIFLTITADCIAANNDRSNEDFGDFWTTNTLSFGDNSSPLSQEFYLNADTTFNTSVGHVLDNDISTKMLRHKNIYARDNKIQQRNIGNGNGNGHLLSHFFGVNIVRELLSFDEVVGVWFVYAMDDQGLAQILLIPSNAVGAYVKSNGSVIVADESIPCPDSCGRDDTLIGLDQTKYESTNLVDVGKRISEEKIHSWSSNYRAHTENIVHSHYFGKGTLDQIVNGDDIAGLRIHYASDDKGRPTLLLSGELLPYSETSRANTTKNKQYVGGSLSCPGFCPPW